LAQSLESDLTRMEWKNNHPWPTDRKTAYDFQDERADRLELNGNAREPRRIAAVEATYGFGGQTLFATAVIVSFPDFQEIERAFCRFVPEFPRSANLNYFHEGPALVGALIALREDADIIMVHGDGICHPRRCGTACHIGLDFDRPTIGYVRRLQSGSHRPVPAAKGSRQGITLRGDEVGIALRTKENVKPIFISPGFRCDLRFAVDIVTRSLRGFRLPEPVRLAHLMANKYRRRIENEERHRQPEPVA